MAERVLFRKPWAQCVGSDRVSTMLRGEYWERFRTFQKAVPVKYIRCHGLLGDELGVVRRLEWEGGSRLVYNFTYLDQIFDTMLEHKVRPFVEWGFMPEALASGTQTIFWWKGNVTPPKEWQEWADLVTRLTEHWIDRYGREEVRTWPFEVWNEPNLTGFWKDADQEAYFRLYETTARAVKAVDGGILVGGPAICGGMDHWIDDFLTFVKRSGVPLDFFTRHLYAGQPPKLTSPEFFYQAMSEPHKPIDELREVRARIDANGFAGLPLHITEFNSSYHPFCPTHDTAFNAAYLARLLAESGDLVETMSYWTFCDLFEETDIGQAVFYGGFGMIARHGILKPTYHLFAFFQQLGEEVVYRDEGCVVTKTLKGLALVAWNPCPTAEERPHKVVRLDLPWAGGRALALRSRVSEDWGNPWGLWRTMGRPKNPDKAVVELLKAAGTPRVESALLEGGPRLDVRFSLGRNEVTLMELRPFVDESPTYLGLDDSLIDGYGPEVLRPLE